MNVALFFNCSARYRKFNTSSLQPFLCGCAAQKCNVNTQTKIEIPKRIERGPTDILEVHFIIFITLLVRLTV